MKQQGKKMVIGAQKPLSSSRRSSTHSGNPATWSERLQTSFSATSPSHIRRSMRPPHADCAIRAWKHGKVTTVHRLLLPAMRWYTLARCDRCSLSHYFSAHLLSLHPGVSHFRISGHAGRTLHSCDLTLAVGADHD